MAATERPPLRGASVETRVLAVEDGAGARAARPPRGRGAARDPRRRARARRPCASRSRCARPATTSSWPPASCTPRACSRSRARALRDQVLHRRRARRAGLQRRHRAPAAAVRRRARAAQLRRDVGLRRLRQGLDRLDRGRLASRSRTGPWWRASVIAEPARARCAARSARSSARAACTPRASSRADGELTLVREDVGRHNALDKVIGNRCSTGATPLGGSRRAGLRARLLRARAEGRGRRHPGAVRRRRALQPRRRRRAPPRPDARRLPARRALQRLRRSCADRTRVAMSVRTTLRGAEPAVAFDAWLARPRARPAGRRRWPRERVALDAAGGRVLAAPLIALAAEPAAPLRRDGRLRDRRGRCRARR